jgi:hypothetical protein
MIITLASSMCFMIMPLWAQEGNESAEATIEVSPEFNYVTVDGDKEKFREDQWMDDEATGGVKSFRMRYQVAPDTSLDASGHAIFPENNYKARLHVDKKKVGYFEVDYTEFRSYFDGTGGFFPLFTPSYFELDKNLHLDIGNLSVEGGLKLPGLPKLILGYEHRFKDGNKSLLEWGAVTQGSFTRNIFPSFEEVDEKMDAVKAEIEHHIGKVHLGDNFRYEHYTLDNSRHDGSLNLDTCGNQTIDIFQHYKHDALFNTIYSDSWLHDKLYLSTGYSFTSIDGNAAFNMNTVPFGLELFDKNWFSNSIDVNQTAHVGNLNTLIGPYKSFTIYGGLEGEISDKEGDTDAVYPENLPVVGIVSPTGITDTDRDEWGVRESIGIRYQGLAHTTIFVEGEWSQQDFDLSKREIEDCDVAINLEQNAWVNRQRYIFGFNTSPLARTTFSVRYRHSLRDNDYDNDYDNTPNAYPGFITDQDFTTNDVTTRFMYRWMPLLQASLEYQYISTDIETRFETTPPKRVESGEYDASVYGASLTLTPISRLYITQMVSYRDARTSTHNNVPSVENYDADFFQIITDAGFAFDSKTNLKAQYLFSYTDNFKKFYTDGLPLGLENYRHSLLVHLDRRFSEHFSSELRYGFYKYDEDSNGGIDDYTANLFGINCTLHF